jgi:DHA1 family inner membrane transport protein
MENDCTQVPHGRLFLSSLIMSSFASGPISVLASLLLIDIGSTFGTPVGVTGQLNTGYSVSALIVALLTSVLSTRFRHRSLLLGGMMLMLVSSLGCYLAPDFLTMMASFSLSGVGYAMVNPMTFALVGKHLPVESRANAVGGIVAGGALVYVVGAPIIAVVAGMGGWRLPLLEFVVPILFTGLLLSFFGLPKAQATGEGLPAEEGAYHRGFKEVLTNRSAIACLFGDFLRSASFVAIVFFSASFVRQKFNASTDLASLMILGAAMSYVVGSLVSGSFVNRLGRRLSAILAALFAGSFTATYVWASTFYVSVALIVVASWFFGLLASAANSLTLEQIPSFRGMMMSMDTAAFNLGSALGTAVGGIALLFSGYEGQGFVLGAMCIVGAFVWALFAIDPTRMYRAPSEKQS